VKVFDADENRMIGLPYGEKNYDDVLSHFHTIPERYGRMDRQTDRRTDRQTDRFAITIRINNHFSKRSDACCCWLPCFCGLLTY